MSDNVSRFRNISIAIDHAHGETFAEIAKKHGISTGRAHQIWDSVSARLKLGNIKQPTAGEIINAFNEYKYRHKLDHPDTPEGFYNHLEQELAEDSQKMWERKRALGYR